MIKANNWSDKNSLGAYKSGNLIGVIIDKKADLMGGALRLTNETATLVDTLHLTYPFRYCYNQNIKKIDKNIFIILGMDLFSCLLDGLDT